MASVDLKSNINDVVALNSATISTDTTTTGNAIDTSGYESVTFIPSIGTRTDGTYTPLITECDTSGGSYTAVADADLIGTEAAAALNASNTSSRIGYVGHKQFVKFSFVSASTSSGSTGCTCIAVLGSARNNPVA